MDDSLRRLAYDLGLEDELDAALKRARASDCEMKFLTETEESVRSDEIITTADVATEFFIGFGSE